MGMKPEEFERMSARVEGNFRTRINQERMDKIAAALTPDGKERDLHNDIIAECKRRGWLYFHGSMAHRAMRVAGEPDFIICGTRMSCGRQVPIVYFVEAKTGSGKLSIEQQGVIRHAAKFGHTIHVIRSMDEFRNLINK